MVDGKERIVFQFFQLPLTSDTGSSSLVANVVGMGEVIGESFRIEGVFIRFKLSFGIDVGGEAC